jgi:hypothetical protein
MSFHLLKIYIKNPYLFFISLFTFPLFFISLFTFPPGLARGRNTDANPNPRAYTFAWGGEFCMFLFLPSWFAKLLEANFSCIAKIK